MSFPPEPAMGTYASLLAFAPESGCGHDNGVRIRVEFVVLPIALLTHNPGWVPRSPSIRRRHVGTSSACVTTSVANM